MSFSSRNHDLVAHRSALGARQQAFPLREWAREPAQPVGGYDLVHAECEEGGGAECDHQRRRPSLGQVPRVTYRLEAARRWHILWRGDSLSSCSGIEVLREGGPGGGRVRGGRKRGGLHGRPRRQAARANVRLAGHGNSSCRVRKEEETVQAACGAACFLYFFCATRNLSVCLWQRETASEKLEEGR